MRWEDSDESPTEDTLEERRWGSRRTGMGVPVSKGVVLLLLLPLLMADVSMLSGRSFSGFVVLLLCRSSGETSPVVASTMVNDGEQ